MAPLLDGWSVLEEVRGTVEVDGVRLERAGICAAGPGGVVAVGSAAGQDQGQGIRAHYELLERASILESLASGVCAYASRTESGDVTGLVAADAVFPSSGVPGWQYARSNGVALARDWPDACRRARLELAERDRVLRSWYGGRAPERIAVGADAWPRTRRYAWEAYAFLADDTWSGAATVVGVFGFPMDPALPLLRGWAADLDPAGALFRATRECLQGLAFLHDEAVPAQEPTATPTPIYHLDLFLWPGSHRRLRAWLAGAHAGAAANAALAPVGEATVTYVDLTPPTLGGGLRVVKASCPAAVPVVFGQAPRDRFGSVFPHPIP